MLQAKGVTFRATEQPIDTTTAAGKCFMDMLGVFAEFEANLARCSRNSRPVLRLAVPSRPINPIQHWASASQAGRASHERA
jgi:hypothetical protein